MVLSLWYSDSRLKTLFFISNRRKGNKERKKSLILAGKLRIKKMRGMKMRIIICFGVWTRSQTFFMEKYYSQTK